MRVFTVETIDGFSFRVVAESELQAIQAGARKYRERLIGRRVRISASQEFDVEVDGVEISRHSSAVEIDERSLS